MKQNEERMDATIRRLAEDYNRPPETPREEMWRRIEAARVLSRGRPRRVVVRWTRWGVGIAALLALGIGLGRMSVTPPSAGPEVAVSEEEGTFAYRLLAAEHLGQVETFLTAFRSDVRTGRVGAEAEDLALMARGLLAVTRLLRDSPAAEDVAIRQLLDDLELVLIQIAQYAVDRRDDELEFIDQGIQQRGVLLKLRSAMAGPAALATEGVGRS